MQTDQLRPLVNDVERGVASLARAAESGLFGDVDRVVASWARLVAFLALGPAPRYRDCPRCGLTGMRDATRCAYCWTKLVPPDAVHAER